MQKALVYVLAVVTSFSLSINAYAVSLIASVPSADTTPKNIFMAAHESQVPMTNAAYRWIGFSFFTYGLTDKLELASTIYNLSVPGSNRIATSLGYKWVQPIFDEWETKLFLGQEFPFSIQGNGGLGHWTFLGSSIRLPKLETRLTAGISYGTKQIFGKDTPFAFFGLEQPFSKQFSFILDYASGDHDLAATLLARQWEPTYQSVVIWVQNWQTFNPKILRIHS